MALLNLTLEPVDTNGGVQHTETSVFINENIETGTRVAKIIGWEETWQDLGELTFAFAVDEFGVSQNVGGRYAIERYVDPTTGEVSFYLVVGNNGGEDFFDADDPEFAFHDGIAIDVTALDEDDNPVLVHQGVFNVRLNNLNEAPTFEVNGQSSFPTQAGSAVSPFLNIDLADEEFDELTLTISFANANGELGNIGSRDGVVVTDPDPAGTTRSIQFTGSAAALMAYLDGVTFTPAAGGVTAFDFALRDAANNEVLVDDGITVTATTQENDAPTFFVPEDRRDFSIETGTATDIFNGIDLFNEETEDLTLTIEFLAAGRTLTFGDPAAFGIEFQDNGVDGNGVQKYTLVGDDDALQNFLAAAQFTAQGPGQTMFDFTLTDGANGVQTYDNAVTVTAAEDPPDNTAPTDIILSRTIVRELSRSGTTIVGELSAVDNEGGPMTFNLVDTADGRFSLSGNATIGWTIRVADGVKIDFEKDTFHNIVLTATDSGGLESEEITIRIDVKNLVTEATTGSNGDDSIKAGSRNDNLAGGLGNDTIYGGGGHDLLEGGDGNDVFVFDTFLEEATNLDELIDFNENDDHFYLSLAVFQEVFGDVNDESILSADAFCIGAEAQTEDHRIIYDDQSGSLMYDMDGTGEEVAVTFAILSNIPATLAASNFILI